MATIIDALVMTLGLDASDYQKNSQKVKKENQSFTEEQKKQLDKIEKQAKQALSAISNVQKGILGLFTAVAGATGVGQFLTQVNQAEAALGRLSSHTGQSTEELHKWSNMAAIVGGSAEDMQAGVSNLQQQLTDLKYKGEMGSTVTFLAQMGVAVADTNGEMRKQSDIMLDLSDRAKNMKKEDFYNLASSSGMTDSQIDLIMKGRTELEKMMIAQEENALVTKEQAEEARKLQAEWEMMKQSMFSAGVRILHDLMPIIQLIAEGLRELFNFLQKHRGIIYGFFIGLAAAMLPVLLTATALVGQFLLLASPIIAVSLAIGLLIDDFLTWQEGGESLFGTFYDWFDKLIDKVTGFGDLLKAIFTGDWAKVSEIIARKIQTVVEEAPKSIKEAHQAAVGVATDMIENAANFFKGDKPKEATPTDSKGLPNFAQNAEMPAIKKWVDQKVEKAKDILLDATSVVVGTTQMASEVQQGVQSGSTGHHLGWLSAKYEGKIGSANKDVDQDGNPAGWAYGKYQFNSAKGGLQKFFSDNPEIAKQFNGLKPETSAFAKKWKELAKNDPTGFERAQDKSAANLWFKPASGAYSKAGFNLNNEGVREAVFSSSIQHGGVVRKLLPLAQKLADKNISELSDKEQIELIYKARMKYYPNGRKRYEDELKSALDVSENNSQFTSSNAGARAQASIGQTSNRSSTTQVDTNVGAINIYTQATDTNLIAQNIGVALDNALRFNVYAVDSGLT